MKEQASDRLRTYLEEKPEIIKFRVRLLDLFNTPQAAARWMKTPNIHFNQIEKGASPTDMIRQRRTILADCVIDAIEYGIFA